MNSIQQQFFFLKWYSISYYCEYILSLNPMIPRITPFLRERVVSFLIDCTLPSLLVS